MKIVLLLLLFLVVPVIAQERYPSQTLEFKGTTWTYWVAEGGPNMTTAVVLLHGAGGSGGSYLANTGFGQLASQQHFLCVAPDGQPKDPAQSADFAKNPRVWNAETDEPFLEKLAATLRSKWGVRRVFIVGHSNGGFMAFAAARRHPARWAGVAAVGSLPPADNLSALNAKVPTLAILGADDKVIPFAGGAGQTPWGPRAFPPFENAFKNWAEALGYATTSPQWVEEPNRISSWTVAPDCVALKVHGQGHIWPGWLGKSMELFEPNRHDWSCAERIWAFFQQVQ